MTVLHRFRFVAALLFTVLSSHSKAVTPFTRVAIMGDFNLGPEGSYYQDAELSYFRGTLPVRLQQQIDFVPDQNHLYTNPYQGSAYFRDTVLPLVLKTDAEACVISIGRPDYMLGVNSATSAATVASICKSLADQGITPILLAQVDNQDPTYIDQSWITATRAALKSAVAADSRIVYVDSSSVLDTDHDGLDQIGFYNGGSLNLNGASRLVALTADLLRDKVRPRDVFADVIWATPNPDMLAAKTGDTSPAEWSITAASPADTEVNSSLIPRTDVAGNWWQISASNPSASPALTIRFTNPNPTGLPSPGQRVEVLVEYQTDADISNDWTIGTSFFRLPPSSVPPPSGVSLGGGDDVVRNAAGILRYSYIDILPGSQGATCSVSIKGSGTFRLGRVGLRRLAPSYPGPYAGDHDAVRHGVTGGQTYYLPDLTTHVEGSLVDPPVLTSTFATSAIAGDYTGSCYAQDPVTKINGAARGGVDVFHINTDCSFTARGVIDGVKFTLKGKFPPSSSYNQAFDLPGGPAIMSLHPYKGSDGTIRINGTIQNVDDASDCVFVDLVRAGGTLLTASQAGTYTAFIPDDAGAPVTEPRGAGVAALTVKADGSLRCNYILADGTRGTRSAKLAGSVTPVWQFYFPIYGGNGKAGLLAGHVTLREQAATGEKPVTDLDGILSWKRSAKAKSALFPAGFDVQRDIYGARYTPQPKGAAFFPGVSLSASAENAIFETGAGAIPASSIQARSSKLAAVSTVTVDPPLGGVNGADGSILRYFTWTSRDASATQTGLSLRGDRKTGLMTGTYRHPATGARLSLSAALIGTLDQAPGAFQTKTGTGSLSIYPRPQE